MDARTNGSNRDKAGEQFTRGFTDTCTGVSEELGRAALARAGPPPRDVMDRHVAAITEALATAGGPPWLKSGRRSEAASLIYGAMLAVGGVVEDVVRKLADVQAAEAKVEKASGLYLPEKLN